TVYERRTRRGVEVAGVEVPLAPDGAGRRRRRREAECGEQGREWREPAGGAGVGNQVWLHGFFSVLDEFGSGDDETDLEVCGLAGRSIWPQGRRGGTTWVLRPYVEPAAACQP